MISSTDNKQIKKVISLLEKGKTRREEGLFVAEGSRLLEETPESDIVAVYMAESSEPAGVLAEKLEALKAKADSSLSGSGQVPLVETVSDAVFKKMSDTVTSQGILAVVRTGQYSLKDIVKPGGLYLVLETLQDPGNLGTIMRTAEGAGVDGVIMSRDTVDIYNPKTVRATMGAIYRQPFVYVDDLQDAIGTLKEAGITCYAAHLKGESLHWDQDYKPGTAFFIGNEGNGLSDKTAGAADKYIKIPMGGKLESLNAAVSAALLSYEARRQRSTMAGKVKNALTSIALIVSILLWLVADTKVEARNAGDLLGGESIGATVVFDPKAYNGESTERLGIEYEEDEVIETSTLVMANVRRALHVRAAADIESEIVGKIYRDCGGKVLDRGEEWSLIQTGELIGWASNEYLLFEDEAEALAREVGFTNVRVLDKAVFVKSEPDSASETLGLLAQNAEYEVINEEIEGWIGIAYGDYDGYVPADSVKITFEVDHGETMAVINERKRLEEEARLAEIRARESMQSPENLVRLLGALIQCEAGGEPYEGMLAVGAVVMNRVRSGAYPGTVYDVIYASGQFTPAKTGSLSRVYAAGPKAICMQAAQEALNGYTNVGAVTHFRRVGTKEGIVIGHHVFY